MRAEGRRKTGFTLIELLVAISVLAMVAVLGWRGLDAIIRGRIALTSDIEQTRGMQLAFAQLESDCAHIPAGSLVLNRPTLLADQGRLLLVRTVFAYDQPTRIQVVAYRLNDGQLTREESLPTRDLKVLDTTWQNALRANDSAQAVVMQSGVTTMSMRTWAGTGWRDAAVDVAPAKAAAGTTASTPTGLEVALQLQDRPGKLVKVFLLGTV